MICRIFRLGLRRPRADAGRGILGRGWIGRRSIAGRDRDVAGFDHCPGVGRKADRDDQGPGHDPVDEPPNRSDGGPTDRPDRGRHPAGPPDQVDDRRCCQPVSDTQSDQAHGRRESRFEGTARVEQTLKRKPSAEAMERRDGQRQESHPTCQRQPSSQGVNVRVDSADLKGVGRRVFAGLRCGFARRPRRGRSSASLRGSLLDQIGSAATTRSSLEGKDRDC